MTSQEQFTKRCSLSLNIQKKKKVGGLYVSTRLSGCMWTWMFWLAAYKGFLKIWRWGCQKWVTTSPGLGTTRTHQCSLEVWLWFWVAREHASCTEWCWLQRNHSRSAVSMCLGARQCSSLGMLVTPQTIKSVFYNTSLLCGGFCGCCLFFFFFLI